jgi:outer membrane immunogenic protein
MGAGVESVMRGFSSALAAGLLISAGIGGAALAADLDMNTDMKMKPDMAMNADMAVKARSAPMSSWTGLYGGVNGGGAFGNTTGALNTFTRTPGTDFTGAVAAGGTPRNLGAKHNGGFGGAQLGHNWQIGDWVFGVETDIQGADIGNTSTTNFGGGAGIQPSVSTGRDHIDWFGTLRGRAGITVDQVLFYGTAGLAYGGVKSSATNIFTPAGAGVFAGTNNSTRVGWAAGAGVEWAFAPSWTVKGEYLHVDLGSTNVTIADPIHFPNAFATYQFNHAFDTVRVGVNYRFGWVIPAMAMQ